MGKVIDFAYKRMMDEDAIGNDELVGYWRAYLDGAIAQQKEDLKEREAFLIDLLGKEPERKEV